MNPFRGIVMILAGCIAFYRGWQIHTGYYAWLAYDVVRARPGAHPTFMGRARTTS